MEADSKYVAMYPHPEYDGGQGIELVATKVAGINDGYKIKFSNSRTMNRFLARKSIIMVNTQMNPIVDRKSGKALLKFKFDNNVKPEDAYIKFRFSVCDEAFAEIIYNQLTVQALEMENKMLKRRLEQNNVSL